ncbi:4Fe-4S binding protein [Rhodobacter sp. NSM]|uniref:4Fe-4S binding protein n=1 Tax=Rhodobacter sp. NSM TaxID=3457501 RepID=UPI003FD54A60
MRDASAFGRSLLLPLFAAIMLLVPALVRADAPFIAQFASEVPAAELVPGADGYGALREDIPVVPVLKRGETEGYAYITSDFVGTTGYSGKPIHVMVALGLDGKVLGVRLVKHSEPIVLVGIPDTRIKAMAAGYVGMDLVQEAAALGSAHDLDIISGATVTVMVIDDSVVRSGLKVARALGLGGLSAGAASSGPRLEVNPEAEAPADWLTLTGDGTVRRLSLDVGQINAAFEQSEDPRAAARPHAGAPDTTFIDMYASLVSVPGIGRSLLGPDEEANLAAWLQPGDHALMLAGRGEYSYKGSGYVRGGIFDRIVLVQGDLSIRFRDRMHRRLGDIAADAAPHMTEMDLFRIPADSGFDPAQPFRIQLLVQRSVGAIEKVFTTFDLGYQLPESYLRPVATARAEAPPAATGEEAAQAQLWKRIWQDNRTGIAALLTMLGVLTAAFFFQSLVTRSARVTFWFRIAFLSTTLVWLGWMSNAQLSVVNLMALVSSLRDGFSWQAFLLDPFTFILWSSVAAALVFWGRGAYCGWLCPFGALQELTNRLAKLARIPQVTLPWGLHERLWALKYVIFLGLFGVSLASVDQAEHLAEIEPFKTAIVLKFARAWPFLLYVGVLLGIGLFVERFYCRYLCPLGAALAIPARVRMFDWLKRYRECGNPCQTCARDCMVQAIHPTGEINPNECLNCLTCQVNYRSETTCPVVIKQLKRRDAAAAATAASRDALAREISNHPNKKEKVNA